MTSIQDLLKHHIEKSGYSVYSISYKAHINRSTLQKIVQGQRKITWDIFDKLIPFFNLTPQELAEMNNAFLISKIGEERYQTHMYIKEIFESSQALQRAAANSDIPYLYTPPCEFPDTFLISDGHKIVDVIYSVLYGSEHPYMYSFCDFQGDFMTTLLRQFSGELYAKIDIRFVTEFAKVDSTCDNLYNLKTLRHLISLISILPTPLRVHYYYNNCYGADDRGYFGASVFPYYIVTDRYVILLAPDYGTALFMSDTNVHRHYLEAFDALTRKSPALFDECISYPELLSHMIAYERWSDSTYKYCINIQPVVTCCIDKQMIDKYIIDTEKREMIASALLLRQKQLYTALSENEHVTYFTSAGLKLLTDKGICLDFISYMKGPFSIPDRISILERTININNNNNNNRAGCELLLRDDLFPASANIQFSFEDDYHLTMVLPMCENPCVMYIAERTLCESINDFFSTIPLYGYSHSLEATNDILRAEIEKLKAQLQ